MGFASDELDPLLGQGEYYVQRARQDVHAAWATVAASAGNLSLFRIDNLIWQVAEIIFANRRRPADSAHAVATKLCSYGASETIASRVGAELAGA